ncbi:MAG: O-antigen ligase family protein [Methylococcaceae bacterium]
MANLSLKYEKSVFFVGIISLIILPNHDIFNWFFAGTLLIIWKQLLAVTLGILSINLLCDARTVKNRGTKHIRSILFVLAFTIFISVILSLIQGLSSIRVMYAVLAYIGMFGGTSFAVATMSLGRTLLVLRIVSILGIISMTGLIIDYYTEWFDFLPRSGDIGLEEQILKGYLRRACFLFGASTTIFPFISFSILSSSILYLRHYARTDKNYFITQLFLAPIALFFTASRAQFLLLGLFMALVLLIISKKFFKIQIVIVLFITLLLSLFGASMLTNETTQTSELTERYKYSLNSDQEGNDTRYQSWQDGIELFSDYSLQSLIGIGLGSSMGMINDEKESTRHYESSFFQAYSEAGYLGLILRYYPGLIALTFLLKYHCNTRHQMIKRIFIAWFVLYFASISTSPTASAYHTQFIYFIAVAFAIKIRLFCYTVD